MMVFFVSTVFQPHVLCFFEKGFRNPGVVWFCPFSGKDFGSHLRAFLCGVFLVSIPVSRMRVLGCGTARTLFPPV